MKAPSSMSLRLMRIVLWTAALLRGIGCAVFFSNTLAQFQSRSPIAVFGTASQCAPMVLSILALVAASIPFRPARHLLVLVLLLDYGLLRWIKEADIDVVIANGAGFGAATLAALTLYLTPFRKHFAAPDPEAPPR